VQLLHGAYNGWADGRATGKGKWMFFGGKSPQQDVAALGSIVRRLVFELGLWELLVRVQFIAVLGM
jgi:hypothetical protein